MQALARLLKPATKCIKSVKNNCDVDVRSLKGQLNSRVKGTAAAVPFLHEINMQVRERLPRYRLIDSLLVSVLVIVHSPFI
jgi:hypothetical protein